MRSNEIHIAGRGVLVFTPEEHIELGRERLRHLPYWLLTSFDEARTSFLARAIARLEGRRAPVRRLLASAQA